MNRKIIIGIPIKNLENPMSRLSEVLTQDERIHTQKELIRNMLINRFLVLNLLLNLMMKKIIKNL